MQRYHLSETASTMSLLASPPWAEREDRYLLLSTDYQTAGRGQRGNSWEAERGQNLLFSLAVRPAFLAPSRQFFLSEATALAVRNALAELTEGIVLKWSNDIYYKDFKVGGILLEHQLAGNSIRRTVIGIGLNVNQRTFRSDAPNPLSLCHILGRPTDRETLLQRIVVHFKAQYERLERGDTTSLHADYLAHLYRREGFHPYRDAEGAFRARLQAVSPDGTLLLEDTEGRTRSYQFKEVSFILPSLSERQHPASLCTDASCT